MSRSGTRGGSQPVPGIVAAGEDVSNKRTACLERAHLCHCGVGVFPLEDYAP